MGRGSRSVTSIVLLVNGEKGDKPFASSSIGGLISLIESNNLVDVGFCLNTFTRDNRRSYRANICQRLDRGMCNLSWRELFPKLLVAIFPL